jgi:hypothetical protein
VDTDTIKRRIELIEKLQGEIKIAKDMLNEALTNDSAYTDAAEEAKVASSKKKQILSEIYNQPANNKLQVEIKENRDEIMTLKEMLSEELIEYRIERKSEVIEVTDGSQRGFKFSVRLTAKK